jgi:intraflagellar transport protein 172
MEHASKRHEAEKLYVQVNEVDLAIAMYKKHAKHSDMIRLVTAHRGDMLKETHMFLAQQLELEGSLKEAEQHYAAAGEWLTAVNMYRSLEQWEDALRVAKFHGGANAQKRVAYAWALALGGDKGAKMLFKQGLIEPAIDYATESRDFGHAFELAQAAAQHKLPDVHLKHALFLEDEERFLEAEQEFVLAGKPREAIDMLLHQKDWTGALRVAHEHDTAAVSDVLCAQAEDVLVTAASSGTARSEAEQLFVQASKPERALAMYETAGLWQDAVRVCHKHLPHRAGEVQARHHTAQAASGKGGSKSDYMSNGKMWEQSSNWSAAIDAYLQVYGICAYTHVLCSYYCTCMLDDF